MSRRLHLGGTILVLALFGGALLAPSAHAATTTVELKTYAVLPQVGGEVTVFGSVEPKASGIPVRIQFDYPIYNPGVKGWKDVGTATTDASGEFSVTFTSDFAGPSRLRAVIPGSGSDVVTSQDVSYWTFPAAKPAPTAPTPTVSGSMTVGSTVTADPGSWSPAPAAGFQYRWIRDGVALPAFGRTYRITTADAGHHLTVFVAADAGGGATYRESKPGPAVSPATFTTSPPRIVGVVDVGRTVSADVATWTPRPERVTYQWRRNGTAIPNATADRYTLVAEDAGTALSVTVRAESTGLEPATRTSADAAVPAAPEPDVRTFGDVMEPASTTPLPSTDVTVATSHTGVPWTDDRFVRWDTPGAFTHSLTPKPLGTFISDMFQMDLAYAPLGAEYVGTNSTFKNADVSFTITARRFAIAYRTYGASDARVWIDGRPVTASPIAGWDETGKPSGAPSWIVITLPKRKTVDVRFAGPLYFTGVSAPAADQPVVKATPPRLTLGVLSDSYYESCKFTACMSDSGPIALATRTGFRVWSMSENGTGYAAVGSTFGVAGHESSPFGSPRRLAALRTAPIDALLIAGSANDGPGVTTVEEHAAAVDALLDDIARLRPDLPVVLAGIEPIAWTRSTAAEPYYAAINRTLAGMVQKHDNVVGFIDPYTRSWLTGTGNAADPHGDGNQDTYIGSDQAHLTAAGLHYYQDRMAEALADLPLPD